MRSSGVLKDHADIGFLFDGWVADVSPASDRGAQFLVDEGLYPYGVCVAANGGGVLSRTAVKRGLEVDWLCLGDA